MPQHGLILPKAASLSLLQLPGVLQGEPTRPFPSIPISPVTSHFMANFR